MSDVKDIAGVRANLERIASDIENGLGHADNICTWLGELQADLEKRVGGSAMGEVNSLKVQVVKVYLLVNEFRSRVPSLANNTRALAAKQ